MNFTIKLLVRVSNTISMYVEFEFIHYLYHAEKNSFPQPRTVIKHRSKEI